jgi:SNF2 family DNA or RNA helicase
MPLFSSSRRFNWSSDADGLAIFFERQKDYRQAKAGRGDEWATQGWDRMQRLLESGDAEAREAEGGVFVPLASIESLDADAREEFTLPPAWPGGLRLETHSVPNLPDFSASLRLVDETGQSVSNWSLKGPVLKVGAGELYLPTTAQFAALRAFEQWKATAQRGELQHLLLINALSEAAESGCHLSLSIAGDQRVVRAQECVINVDEKPDGSLELTPILVGQFLPELMAEIEAAERRSLTLADPVEAARARHQLYVKKVAERLHHLGGDQGRAVLRVGRTLIILDEAQTKQAREVIGRRKVPREDSASFRKDPAGYLSNRVFVHGDIEFLPRVLGIGEWKGGYLGASGELGEKIDWFDKKPEPEKKPKPETESETPPSEGGEPETDPAPENKRSGPLVPLIEKNDEQLGWGLPHHLLAGRSIPDLTFDFSQHPRQPFPHQVEAIDWLIAHTRRAGRPLRWQDGDRAWGAGALLADDMGLGKTLTTLLFIGEWFKAWRGVTGAEPPACLIVAPLSLMENWRDEIGKSFAVGGHPFRRVVLAIPDGELRSFYNTSDGRDVVSNDSTGADGQVTKYGLRFRDGTEESLDCPGTCVLTTYQTLREFRFSFAGCDWSAAIFDEAQNLKNPNALQTIAAKSLKGFFRIALTGTPVENHLGDLWSLMDAVEPGALKSWVEFRNTWIRPMRNDPTRLAETCDALRQHLGQLILRRTKAERLRGLPKKELRATKVAMTPPQADLYDEILHAASGGDRDQENPRQRANRWLASMWELRRVSLHPALLGDAPPERSRNAADSRAYFRQSGKLAWLLDTLDRIAAAGEKALIFSVQKRLQDMLADHLGRIYSLTIPIINGDTKATSRNQPNETRLGLIKQFSARPGFGICVLSPIAAGAGLNIVAANHVIHLERHWNPAKEDQATDRAYRIGQTREVLVYFPLLIHPRRDITTFDTGLDKLIAQKRNLAGALGLAPVAPVSTEELFDEVFGKSKPETAGPSHRLGADEARKLSWEHFEALIAEIYERDSDEVILTPRSRDGGADVIVLDHKAGHHSLIQCKATAGDKLDSELAIREVEGARFFFEQKLNVKFAARCIHTNTTGFSRRTVKAASSCGVSLHGFSWLRERLNAHEVTLAQVIARNSRRRSV